MSEGIFNILKTMQPVRRNTDQEVSREKITVQMSTLTNGHSPATFSAGIFRDEIVREFTRELTDFLSAVMVEAISHTKNTSGNAVNKDERYKRYSDFLSRIGDMRQSELEKRTRDFVKVNDSRPEKHYPYLIRHYTSKVFKASSKYKNAKLMPSKYPSLAKFLQFFLASAMEQHEIKFLEWTKQGACDRRLITENAISQTLYSDVMRETFLDIVYDKETVATHETKRVERREKERTKEDPNKNNDETVAEVEQKVVSIKPQHEPKRDQNDHILRQEQQPEPIKNDRNSEKPVKTQTAKPETARPKLPTINILPEKPRVTSVVPQPKKDPSPIPKKQENSKPVSNKPISEIPRVPSPVPRKPEIPVVSRPVSSPIPKPQENQDKISIKKEAPGPIKLFDPFDLVPSVVKESNKDNEKTNRGPNTTSFHCDNVLVVVEASPSPVVNKLPVNKTETSGFVKPPSPVQIKNEEDVGNQ